MATYSFDTPTRPEIPIATKWPWLRGILLPQGISLKLGDDGLLHEMRWPTREDYLALEDGKTLFQGGYAYRGVDEETADLIRASGYGDGLREEAGDVV